MEALPKVLKSFSRLTRLDRLSDFTLSILMSTAMTAGATLAFQEEARAELPKADTPQVSQNRPRGKVILLSQTPVLKVNQDGTLAGHYSHRSHMSHSSHRSHYSSRY